MPGPIHAVPRSARWGWLYTALLVLAAQSVACIDPDQKYEDFLDRAGANESGGDGDIGIDLDGGTVVLPEPEQLSGIYYYVVALPPYETTPTIYLLEVQASREGETYTIMMRDRPLLFSDRKTQTGEWSEWHSTTVGVMGTYELTDLVVATPAAANPLGMDTESRLTFQGNVGTAKFESGPESPVRFWCGTAKGELIKPPLGIPLDGKFTATRIADPNNPDTYPPAVIDCDETPADPL